MQIAVFHGTKGSPDGNWFPWLKQQLEPTHTVSIPALPTPQGQDVPGWIQAVQDQIFDIRNHDVLIGHSCGASFIPHLVLSLGLTPQKIIMVSAFQGEIHIPEYDALNASFFLPQERLLSFKDHVKLKKISLTLFHGDNDPYVPLSHAQTLAGALDQPLQVIKNGGHLNFEFGFTTFPDLLHVLV